MRWGMFVKINSKSFYVCEIFCNTFHKSKASNWIKSRNVTGDFLEIFHVCYWIVLSNTKISQRSILFTTYILLEMLFLKFRHISTSALDLENESRYLYPFERKQKKWKCQHCHKGHFETPEIHRISARNCLRWKLWSKNLLVFNCSRTSLRSDGKHRKPVAVQGFFRGRRPGHLKTIRYHTHGFREWVAEPRMVTKFKIWKQIKVLENSSVYQNFQHFSGPQKPNFATKNFENWRYFTKISK